MFAIAIISLSGFFAGGLNAVAGGGTFLTFPALVYLGVPPIAANATATFVALPGYCGSAYAYRRDIAAEGSLGLVPMILVAACGSITGALLLLVTPAEIFDGIVPWLLLLATALFALGPWLLQELRRRGGGHAGPLISAAAIFAVSILGGYFNGGLGIMLLATFGLLGYVNLHGMNGLKNVLSALLSLLASVTFAIAGLIVWHEAAVMSLASLAGGYVGAWLARRVTRTELLRAGITGIGLVMTAVFFVR